MVAVGSYSTAHTVVAVDVVKEETRELRVFYVN
jgi:hypothetical protein